MGIVRHPLVVFVLTLAVLWLSAWVGARFLGRRRTLDEETRNDLGVIVAATLTLLGLIVGFSFSMAIGRYDQRKNYEEEEANAIGTEYLRADLLPAGDGATVRTLLKKYVDLRIASYTTSDDAQLRDVDARTAAVQNKLWSSIQPPAAAQPTPIVALAVSGMNDVLNSQGYTQAADRNRIPTTAWTLMLVIAVCCNVLLGWGAHRGPSGALLRLVLPVVGALAFMLIADIDTPRHGIIHVAPDNLISLSHSLGT